MSQAGFRFHTFPQKKFENYIRSYSMCFIHKWSRICNQRVYCWVEHGEAIHQNENFFFSIILVAVEMNLKANIYKRRCNVKVPSSFSRAQFDRALSNMFDVQIYTQRHVQKFAKYDLELSFLETYHRLLHIHTERKKWHASPHAQQFKTNQSGLADKFSITQRDLSQMSFFCL